MSIHLVDQNFDEKIWENAAKHPLQSWAWGEARKQMGIEVLRIAEYKNKEIANVFQLTIHPLPLTNYKIGYLPRSVLPSKEVLNYLYQYGKKNKIIFFKIEPYVEISNIKYQKSKIHIKNQKLIKSKHPLFPEWTIILDLTKSEEELLKAMHYKTRYNIRLAQRKGVIVKEMSNDEGFRIFSKLYFDTCRRQKYFGHTEKYHQIVWNNLKNKISHILIAFYHDTPLAAYELFHFKDTVYYPYGGSSLAYRNLMAPNLLMWQSILLAKKLGAKKFDFWGALPPDYKQNHPWAGFTRFKQGYGGQFTQMIGSYDLVISPFYYQIYTYTYFFRQIFLKLRRNFS